MILVLSKMSPNCQKFSRHHLCMAGDYLAQPCTASLQRSENYSGSLVLGPEISLTIGCMNMRGKIVLSSLQQAGERNFFHLLFTQLMGSNISGPSRGSGHSTKMSI